MGFFDPPHRKILDKAPVWFQERAVAWGAFIELVLPQVPKTGHDLFRTVVIGSLAELSSGQRPEDWSIEARRYIDVATGNAARFLPGDIRTLADQTVEAIIRADRQRNSN